MNYKKIEIEDKMYPEKLRKIEDPPNQLYVIGNISLLKEDMLAIVGTRHITEYGKKYVRKFATEIALRNIPIISGMAIGTDSEAHKIALKYNSPTIAVLGTGLNNIFPEENMQLYEDILKSNGLIITEVHPDTKYNSKSFPLRNRIVSGLAEGILVIEAGYRSGTSITVNFAKEQGKKVFAIPGRLGDKASVGTNAFIKEGALLTTDINDILEYYPQFMNKKMKSNTEKKVKSEYRKIYNLLKNKNCNIDEIARELKNKSVSEINNLLTMMELEDLIIRDFGNGYKIKEENA